MKRWLILLVAGALLLSGCGPGVGKGPYSVLSVDAATNTLEIETGDGLIFVVIAPEELDIAAMEPGMTLPVDEDFNDAIERMLEAGEEEREELSAFCTSTTRQHPRLRTLAGQSDVDYETLLEYFCEGGLGAGDLMQAIGLVKRADLTLEEVIELYEELGSWGAVKKELGLIGKPDDKPGKADDAQQEEDD